MHYVYQNKFGNNHDKPDEVGNCYAAAVASLLELTLEDVPDITPVYDDFHERWDAWFLDTLGLTRVDIEINLERAEPIHGYAIATVWSRVHEGGTHAVVTKDGHVIHDPNPNNDVESYELSDILSYDFLIDMQPQERLKNAAS